MIFRKKPKRSTYDTTNKKPVIRASICTGEQVAGFLDKKTGDFQEISLIRNPRDLEEFKETYGIIDDIEKIY
ncbi:MAG: aspartate dehydrogenase [Lachnospiraceae bacterium]|jgi:hypothetical protein|nr:aspartate dehydrogenase [Lachnospiraceae bacterium]MBQ6258306.1 aspartate dehydrogenase [Lachnospiraceae bacterium]